MTKTDIARIFRIPPELVDVLTESNKEKNARADAEALVAWLASIEEAVQRKAR